MEAIRESIAITVVLGLLWLSVWWLRRRGTARLGLPFQSGGRRKELEVLQRVHLTAQHSIHLVRIKESNVVIGVYPGGISILGQPEGAAK